MPTYSFTFNNGKAENPTSIATGTGEDPGAAFEMALDELGKIIDPIEAKIKGGDGSASDDEQKLYAAVMAFTDAYPPPVAFQMLIGTYEGIKAGDPDASAPMALIPDVLGVQQAIEDAVPA